MNKDNANTLLQYLVGELNKPWTGQPSEIKTAADAYEVCRQIVEEMEDADNGKSV